MRGHLWHPPPPLAFTYLCLYLHAYINAVSATTSFANGLFPLTLNRRLVSSMAARTPPPSQAFVLFLTGVVFFKKGVAAFSRNGVFDFIPCLSAMSESRSLLLAAERLASIHVSEKGGGRDGVIVFLWARAAGREPFVSCAVY